MYRTALTSTLRIYSIYILYFNLKNGLGTKLQVKRKGKWPSCLVDHLNVLPTKGSQICGSMGYNLSCKKACLSLQKNLANESLRNCDTRQVLCILTIFCLFKLQTFVFSRLLDFSIVSKRNNTCEMLKRKSLSL